MKRLGRAIRPALRAVRHSSLWLYRGAMWALLLLGVLFLASALLVRYALLPNIGEYRDEIAQAISRAANQRVTIGGLEGEWDGLRLRLAMHDVRVYDDGGMERLALSAIDAQLSWTSLLVLEPRFHFIQLRQLSFEVRRDREGRFWVAGMPLQQYAGQDGFGNWLLEQEMVGVRDASLTWVDETLGGEPLLVRQTDLQVQKRIGSWRFALRAVPPAKIAGPIDLRGDLARDRRGPGAKWSGKLYYQMGYADLSALRRWIAIPFEVLDGAGAVEVWSRIDAGRLRELTADVALTKARLRLRPGLPELALSRMSGRLTWQQSARGTTYGARRLSFTTPDGLTLAPADISYGRQGEDGASDSRSHVVFDRLDLAAVMRLLDRLPLDASLRERLAEAAPRGLVRDFELRWVGPFQTRRSYLLRAQFDRLGLSPSGFLPGFAAVSGTIEAAEEGGVVNLRTGKSEVAMPRVFAEALPLESLDARVTWTHPPGGPLIGIERASFANAHLAGQVSGTYRVVPGQPGTIALTGNLTRGDAREVWRYIPLRIPERIRNWLKDSLLAGKSEDVRFRLRGDLRRFPFVDPATGIFEVVTRFQDGAMAYVPGWPAIEGASGELVFRAASMTVTVPQARVYGTQLREVSATIPDLADPDHTVQVRGVAEGPSQDFQRFIQETPVDRWIGGFTRGMRASGRGTLNLSLSLPLHRLADAAVQGTYRFAGNALDLGHGAPRLEELNGELRFTERHVRVDNSSVRVLGMPARFSVQREGPGLVIRGRGRADTAAVRALIDHPVATRLSGNAEWQAVIGIRDGGFEVQVDSDLRGLASALPAPFAKDAARVMPFRYERRSAGGADDLTVLSIGTLLSAQLQRGRDAPDRVARGEVRLNAPAPAPSRDGVWVSGTMAVTDYDAWRAVFDAPEGGGQGAQLSGVSLQIGTVRAYGRYWNDVQIGLTRAQEVWRGRIDARQAVGTFQWSSAGNGALAARLEKLHVPEAPAEVSSAVPSAGPASLPALDLAAEDFRLGRREFGRMVLVASPQAREWRIRRFEALSSKGSLRASGLWQSGARTPVTNLDVAMETGDIGAYLGALGLPPGVVGGTGSLQGQLSWVGAPPSIDLPSLRGSLQLRARNGRFAKAQPGIGKLIGVISLQALPRRVTLDFGDVFSDGFAFDSIASDIVIERGVARMRNFSMVGPAARVEMQGEVSLPGETQRLDVKVLPALSESVALGAAFLNPAIGIAALLAQKAFNDPINQLAAFEYEVSGTWSDPIVLKKRRDNADQARPGRQ